MIFPSKTAILDPSGGSMPPLSQRVFRVLADVRIPPTLATLSACSLAAFVTFGDVVTGADATFTLFYVVPLAVAVWYGRRFSGELVAVLSTLGGISGRLLDRPRISAGSIAWNAVAELTLYLAFGWVLGALRARLASEAAARRDALGQLRHAERLTTVGKLASGLAHEIGTPLNVISGHAELIADNERSPEEVRTSAQVVLEQTARVSIILRQLLDFARRGGAHPETTDLSELTRATVELLRPLAAKSRVRIACSGERTAARVNRSELQQVLTNLVTNAMHAMPGGGSIEVSTHREVTNAPGHRTSERRGYAVVSVRDHGTGIAIDVLPKIFDPFFTTKDVGRGTGLGLSVAYGIVADHHGWISIDTAEGRGTTVTVHLPE